MILGKTRFFNKNFTKNPKKNLLRMTLCVSLRQFS
jgi:hypothetical protein